MTDELGYDRYVAHGGDIGAGVTSRLAAAHPEAVLGVHLMAVGAPITIDHASLTTDEQSYLDRVAAWTRDEGGYMHQQSTRPLSLAYGLSDSPTGLLAWILDKYHAWSDNHGSLSDSFSDDFLLTQASLYWFTNTIGTSFRPYYEHGRDGSRRLPYVDVPTAVSLFPAESPNRRDPGPSAPTASPATGPQRAVVTSPRSRCRTCWPTTFESSSTRCCRSRPGPAAEHQLAGQHRPGRAGADDHHVDLGGQ